MKTIANVCKPTFTRTAGRIMLVTDNENNTYRFGVNEVRRFRASHPEGKMMFDKAKNNLYCRVTEFRLCDLVTCPAYSDVKY